MIKKIISILLCFTITSGTFLCPMANAKVISSDKKITVSQKIAMGAVVVSTGALAALGIYYIFSTPSDSKSLDQSTSSIRWAKTPYIGSSLPKDLKAIKWERNLCWFISTILMFYYQRDVHDAIIGLNCDNVRAIMNKDTSKMKNGEVLIRLSELFKHIDACNGHIYAFAPGEADGLFHALKDVGLLEKTKQIGSFGEPFIFKLADFLHGNKASELGFKCPECVGNIINEIKKIYVEYVKNDVYDPIAFDYLHTSLSNDFSCLEENIPLKKQCSEAFQLHGFPVFHTSPGHFYITVTRDGKKYNIGKSINDLRAIEQVR